MFDLHRLLLPEHSPVDSSLPPFSRPSVYAPLFEEAQKIAHPSDGMVRPGVVFPFIRLIGEFVPDPLHSGLLLQMNCPTNSPTLGADC